MTCILSFYSLVCLKVYTYICFSMYIFGVLSVLIRALNKVHFDFDYMSNKVFICCIMV